MLPSSHSSPVCLNPSPHSEIHAVLSLLGTAPTVHWVHESVLSPLIQIHPSTICHEELQPPLAFPSSHSSEVSLLPSPHCTAHEESPAALDSPSGQGVQAWGISPVPGPQAKLSSYCQVLLHPSPINEY